MIIVVNKWDAIEKNDKTMREYESEVRGMSFPLCLMQRLCMCLQRQGRDCHKLIRYDRHGDRESDTCVLLPVSSMRL